VERLKNILGSEAENRAPELSIAKSPNTSEKHPEAAGRKPPQITIFAD